MPYLSKEDKRAYQREWARKRREAFFQDKFCVDCGSTQGLQLDHVDQSTKLYNPSQLWGMSEDNPKRVAELRKCQVLCKPCHERKSNGIGGDIHKAIVTTSKTLVCARGHNLNEVGWKKSVKPNGFVSKQCLYCSYINKAKRRGATVISLEEHVNNRRLTG